MERENGIRFVLSSSTIPKKVSVRGAHQVVTVVHIPEEHASEALDLIKMRRKTLGSTMDEEGNPEKPYSSWRDKATAFLKKIGVDGNTVVGESGTQITHHIVPSDYVQSNPLLKRGWQKLDQHAFDELTSRQVEGQPL